MFRLAVLVVALASCTARAAPAPAWPKMHEAEADGGESIAPRTRAVATVEKAEEAKPAPPAAPAPAATAAPAAKEPAGAAAPAAVPASVVDEPTITDDIIIDIDD